MWYVQGILVYNLYPKSIVQKYLHVNAKKLFWVIPECLILFANIDIMYLLHEIKNIFQHFFKWQNVALLIFFSGVNKFKINGCVSFTESCSSVNAFFLFWWKQQISSQFLYAFPITCLKIILSTQTLENCNEHNEEPRKEISEKRLLNVIFSSRKEVEYTW